MHFPMKTSYRDDLRLFRNRSSAMWYGLLFAVLILLPFVFGEYVLSQATFVFINGMVAMGMVLLVGYTGQISLGHAAFFAVGAYTAAVLETRGLPFVPALLDAGALSAVIGVAVGLPALRMKGIYLAMATLAFAFIVEEVIVRWGSVTKGNRGMTVTDATIFGYKMGSVPAVYYLS